MMNFLELASAVSVLYQYFADEPKESDFTEIADKDYQNLPQNDQNQRWFRVSDRVLKKEIINQSTALIVNEKEKHAVFSAAQLIQSYTKDLPDLATFKERLLYSKKALPPILVVEKHIRIAESYHLKKYRKCAYPIDTWLSNFVMWNNN